MSIVSDPSNVPGGRSSVAAPERESHRPLGAQWVLVRGTIAVAVMLALAPASRAEHAKIDLSVSGQGQEATATADREPPAGGLHDPPQLKVEANKPLVMQFILTDAKPHGVIKHVTVRYYVVRVAKLGRKPPPSFRAEGGSGEKQPLLEKGVVTKGQVTMNFKPDCRVGAADISPPRGGHLFGPRRDPQYPKRPRALFRDRLDGQIRAGRSRGQQAGGAGQVPV